MRITHIYTKPGIEGIADGRDFSSIPDIEVKDPTSPHSIPIYVGPAKNACIYLIPGVYDAYTQIDSFDTILDIKVVVTQTHSYATDVDGIALSGRINAQ